MENGDEDGLSEGDQTRDMQPMAVMRQLAAGLAVSIAETLGDSVDVVPAGLGVRLEMPGEMVEIDIGYPWDLGLPLAQNIEGNTEIALGHVQAVLAEATTEPWPARVLDRPTDAQGLPRPVVRLVG